MEALLPDDIKLLQPCENLFAMFRPTFSTVTENINGTHEKVTSPRWDDPEIFQTVCDLYSRRGVTTAKIVEGLKCQRNFKTTLVYGKAQPFGVIGLKLQ
jgi:hypothetical protein